MRTELLTLNLDGTPQNMGAATRRKRRWAWEALLNFLVMFPVMIVVMLPFLLLCAVVVPFLCLGAGWMWLGELRFARKMKAQGRTLSAAALLSDRAGAAGCFILEAEQKRKQRPVRLWWTENRLDQAFKFDVPPYFNEPLLPAYVALEGMVNRDYTGELGRAFLVSASRKMRNRLKVEAERSEGRLGWVESGPTIGNLRAGDQARDNRKNKTEV